MPDRRGCPCGPRHPAFLPARRTSVPEAPNVPPARDIDPEASSYAGFPRTDESPQSLREGPEALECEEPPARCIQPASGKNQRNGCAHPLEAERPEIEMAALAAQSARGIPRDSRRTRKRWNRTIASARASRVAARYRAVPINRAQWMRWRKPDLQNESAAPRRLESKPR